MQPAARLRSGASALPLLRVEEAADLPLDRQSWPGTLAPVRDLLAGLDLGPATVLVGDNGAGTSTLVEAVARAFGFPADGGSTWEQRQASEGDVVLARHLRLVRGAGAGSTGFFLRAETMHAFSLHLHDLGSLRGELLLSASHGEAFLDLLLDASLARGLWILDEPESALSFHGQLALLKVLAERTASGSQLILSTHSPLLARLEGADVLEVGPWGLRRTGWDDLDLVQHWRAFLDGPERYLRHL